MFYKLMLLEVGQGYPQPWRGRRASSVSQKCCHPGSVHGRLLSLHMRAVRLDLSLDSPLNLFIENGGKEGVFRKSRLSSFAPRAAPVFVPVFLGCVCSCWSEASVWQRSEKQLPARCHHRSSVSRWRSQQEVLIRRGGRGSPRFRPVCVCSLVGTWGGGGGAQGVSSIGEHTFPPDWRNFWDPPPVLSLYSVPVCLRR